MGNSYIGRQSFSLDDDPDYRSYVQSINDADRRLRQTDQELNQADGEFRQANEQEQRLKHILNNGPAEIQRLEQSISQLSSSISNNQSELGLMQQAVGAAEAQVQDTQSQIENNKKSLGAANSELAQTKSECPAPLTPECDLKIQEKTDVVENIKGELVGLESQKGLQQKQVQELRGKIQRTQQKIKSDNELLSKNQNRIAQVQKELQVATAQLTQAEHRTREWGQRVHQLRGQLRQEQDYHQRLSSDFARYRDDLIYNINVYNSNGAVEGEKDGSQDGSEQAISIGESHGRSDGTDDGFDDGTQAGKNRDFARGRQVGRNEGTDQGTQNGTADGKFQGAKQAHIDLGQKEGIANGIARAIKSDAKVVGTQQGIDNGNQRAINDGRIQGRKIGQEEAVKQLESGDLKKVSVDGSYAKSFQGTFSRTIPSLPSGYRGHSFSPSTFNGKDVYRRAFTDGYIYSYDYQVVVEYNNQVPNIYNNTYDSYYRDNYDSAYAKDYPESYKGGYNTGFQEVYNTVYENYRSQYYKLTYDETYKNPNRNSIDYIDSFKQNDAQAYAKKYEEIRKDAFIIADADTYNKMINQRIAEFKAQRIAEVNNIYANHPVLKYESSKINDVGVRKITPHDGYYQPGETVLHSIVIKNFGSKAMVNAKIKSRNGEEVALPEIPARSIVEVNSAVISTLADSLPINKNYSVGIYVLAPLSSEDRVQGLHYSNIEKALLVENDAKDVRVAYPVYVSGVVNDFAFSGLKFGQVQQLKLEMLNMSEVIYYDLRVELISNANNDIFVKKFSPIKEINSGLDLDEAKIIISDIKDRTANIEIKAVLKHKDVILGVIENPVQFKVLP